ncbi:MAG: hypothetical protein KF760_35470 [Candidatus Eremiobacteraeota bacterium]|nr:hypothetical protein [Candidatus Eremiobacteraeota bacterium]MCW5872837.1 hypothetical protein [Candidatus Eremiobacteraeota bacterium]
MNSSGVRFLPWMGLVGILAFNGWGTFSFLFPLAQGWLEAEHARNLSIGLGILGIILPPLWLSRKMKRKRVWFRRYFVLFNLLLAAGLVYWASGRPAPVVLPSPTPVATSLPRPVATPTPVVTATPQRTETPEPAETPVPQFVDSGEVDRKYVSIDEHALKAPPEVEKDVASLAHYLVAPARNDEEKIRAIYRWVADRISYDTEMFFSGKWEHHDGAQTLRSRTAICDGYATLVDELGKAAGLKTEIVPGFANGMVSDQDEKENHAWNAVKLPGGWRLLDATWGAGDVGDDHKFHKRFKPFYFLPPAEQMLVTHFPTESNWQLTLPPISRSEFLKRPKRMPEFFQLGLRVDKLQGQLEANPRADLDFHAPEGLYLSARLESLDGREVQRSTLIDRDGERIVVNAAPPRAGKYRLLIFAFGPGQDHGTEVLEYTVDARSGQPEGYPDVYKPFQEHSGHVFSPSTGFLKAGKQHFELELAGAQKVFVNDWDNELTRDGDRFVGDTDLPVGETKVFAVFSGETGKGILTYEVR